MGSFWKIQQTLAFDLPAGEDYSDYPTMDPSPPETENWTPTERKRKRNPLLFLPEDDNSIKFFEKGLHQTVDRPESERDLTPYGSLNFSWKIQPPEHNSRIEFISDMLWHKGTIQIGRKGYISYIDRGNFYPGVEQNGSKGIIFIKSKDETLMVPLTNWHKYIREIDKVRKASQKLSWGHERNIWVTHWAVPGNQEMNPTSVQQDWTVVTFLPPDIEGDYMNSFKVIKERFKEYVKQNFPETSSEGSDYMWANAYLWNVQSEKSDFLDKYLTTEEINNMKEDTIVVINKKDFPVEVSNSIERI